MKIWNLLIKNFYIQYSIDSSDGFQLCTHSIADECNIGSRPEQLETLNKFEIAHSLPLELQNMFEKFLIQQKSMWQQLSG